MRAFAAAAIVGVASASPARLSDYIRAATNTPAYNGTTTEHPCAHVSRVLANGTPNPVDKAVHLNATIAYQCLQSVPLHAKDAVVQLEGIQTFSQFQSTLAYLKNPPEGYLYPPFDVMTALDQLAEKLDNGDYTNEYDFQIDLRDIISSAKDGHYYYNPDITEVFSFMRPAALFSISKDGVALPDVYDATDAVLFALPNKTNSSVSRLSPVAQINDQDVEMWLNAYATFNGVDQDPDANYNDAVQGFEGGVHYDGDSTKVTFRNGTTRVLQNYATTTLDFTNVTDGKSFFEQFCTGPPASSDATPSSTVQPVIPTTEVPFRAVPTQTAAIYKKTYPVPVIINDDQSVSGYHPKANKDLAVMRIPSFQPTDTTQFANVVREFLAMSKAAGKKKLIIDLRDNPGGTVVVGYDTFTQLFPSLTPYGATNLRANELFNDVGQVVSQFYSNVTNVTISPAECNSNNDFNTPFNYRENLDMDNAPFTSWQDFYGPHSHNGDNFTSLTRYNLADQYALGGCSNISNQGNLTNITPQVFKAEDMLIVQNGACGSTCAVFTEFMKTQAGVKQVVFGGRHQNGPMQGVGGVKGANVEPYSALATSLQEGGEDGTKAQNKAFLDKYGNLTKPFTQAVLRANFDPKEMQYQANVNYRNNIREDDESVTPLQFIYEAADCRLFNTAPQLLQQSLVWDAAYQALWGNGSCVEGSTGHLSSKQGVIMPNTPPANAKNFFGANPGLRNGVTTNGTTAASSGEPSKAGSSAAASSSSVQAYTGSAASLTFNGAVFGLVGLAAAFMML